MPPEVSSVSHRAFARGRALTDETGPGKSAEIRTERSFTRRPDERHDQLGPITLRPESPKGLRPAASYRGRAARGRSATSILELRAERHHVASLARRPRRPEAGAAPHPLRDAERHAARCRRETAQERSGRRRRDGQVPPARRHRDLRRDGPPRAELGAPRTARRGARQLRIDRRRCACGHALHRGSPPKPRRRALGRARREDGRPPAELRQHEDRARLSFRHASRTCS